MLQINSICTTLAEFEEYFAKVANYMLNQVFLMINSKKYRITEIELYYTCPKHPDPFTHKSEIQKQNGKFYFHKTGNSYERLILFVFETRVASAN